MTSFTIVPQGEFSLPESVEFGFGQRHSERFAGVMRLAFVLDGTNTQVGVVVRQDGRGVHGEVVGDGGADPGAVQRQVARVLSLDHDATGFDAVGGRDPVVRQLQEVARGLRPPLFYSPYEAATWSILSARRPAQQMSEVRRHLSEAHGRTFELAGEPLAAFPTPEQLLGVREFPGLTPDKFSRLHGVARATLNGDLDVDRLRRLGPEACIADLQRLKGLGPFYASLVTIRAVGFTDVLPTQEPQLRSLVAQLYSWDSPRTDADFEALAENWRPWRTWVSVLIRAAGGRVIG